ncbi:solute carrier organic anion transporter family member 4A1-like isoform X2 [Nematostella vectensis]|uniref:solute carrier organic anion transporter family member 4A1-like isoform X2 n=1 Tax=Nematostella vectensis TaxID=45351 RepID=UPI0020778D2B|nr:solute carrier organic anion transporter family member 4A1-like isoform X2 [Nematostella vectensis]
MAKKSDSSMGNNNNKVRAQVTVVESLPNGENHQAERDLEPNEEEAWGWRGFRPRCLQFLRSPRWFLVFISLFSLFQAMAVNSFVSIAIPTLERRYSFNSKQTGLLVSANDITALILVSFVSFYGGYGHKTKWLGFGGILTGLGCVMFSLPHFMHEKYNLEGSVLRSSSAVCSLNSTTPRQSPGCSNTDELADSSYMIVFIFAQLLSGAGTTPLHTLGPAYIDENVSPKYSSFYLGVFFSTAMLGPGFGNMIGGKLLSIFVDIKQPAGVRLSPRDPRWIGAWWLGPLVSGCFLFLIGGILLGFPRQLPGAKRRRDEAIAKGIIQKRDRTTGNLADIVPATKSMLRNGTYMFQNMALTASTLVGAGAGPFLFKIIRIRYGGTAEVIGLAVALILIPGAGGGIALGTMIVKFLGLKDAWTKAARCTFFLQLIGIWTALIFLIPGCSYYNYAGVDVAYPNSSLTGLRGACNAACNCSVDKYSPLCGPGGLNYFSPCFAGCTTMTRNRTYTNCACVESAASGAMPSLGSGLCERQCKNLIPFLIGAIVLSVISFSNTIPSKIVTIRSVADNQRGYALGLQFVFIRLLGSLPGPILFGHLIDSTCTLWRYNCGTRGNCLNYKHDRLGLVLMAAALPINAISCIAYFISWRFSKRLSRINSRGDMPMEIANQSAPTEEANNVTGEMTNGKAVVKHSNESQTDSTDCKA